MSKTLIRRLDRLEAELAPPGDGPTLTIEVEFIGSPERNKIIKVGRRAPKGREQWPSRTNTSSA